MNVLIEYQRFPNIEEFTEATSILDDNNIPYQLNDSSLRYELASSVNPMDRQFILMIKESDFEKVNSLLEHLNKKVLENEHYLYSFSDNDIKQIIANPKEWTEDELKIANNIFNKRALVLDADTIQEFRNKDKIKEIKLNHEQINSKSKAASWFLVIGIVSIFNTLNLAFFKWNVNFIFGLGFSTAIDGFCYKILGGFNFIGIFTSILFSSMFIIFWHLGKKKNKSAFITGLTIYSLDLIFFLFLKQWIFVIAHAFAILAILSGLHRIIKEKKA